MTRQRAEETIMSTEMEALHIDEFDAVASNFAERTSFEASQTACRDPARALREHAHRPRMEWIRRLYEHIPDAVFFITDRNRIAACNRAAVVLFGYEECELLGREIDFAWRATPDVQLRGRWAGQGAVRAGLAMTKDGIQFPAALTIIREQGANETFTAAIFEDFRTERETLQQIQELRGELARLARIAALGEMTSTLAHELSQPLSSIAAYSQGCRRLLKNNRRGCGKKVRETLSEITQHALWAGTIIQNIREFAKRGTGEKRSAAMHELIHEATVLARAGFQQKGFHIDFQLEAAHDVVVADRVQIVQVLTNLLRNALEATHNIEQPHITIRTMTDDISRLVVEISDNGCGIAAEIREALFRPFVTNKPHGLGMGLALSKRIIEAHGGRIDVRTGMESGSVLSFSLPLLENKADGERPYDPSRR